MTPTRAVTWSQVITSETTVSAGLFAAAAAMFAEIAGATFESITAISFGAVLAITLGDMATGIFRVMVLDYRVWLASNVAWRYSGRRGPPPGWKSSLSWIKLLHTPFKIAGYTLATWCVAMFFLAVEGTGISVPVIGAMAVMHTFMCAVELASVMGNLSVLPGAARGIQWVLERFHNHGFNLKAATHPEDDTRASRTG